MGLTHFPNGVSSFGIPQIGSPVLPIGGGKDSPATAYYVDPTNGSDSNLGTSPDRPLAKLSRAHALMTANQNDTAFVIGNSSASSTTTVRESATLTWSKNLCHIVGVNAFNRISHRVSIRPVTNDFTPFITISASGCVFANFHVFDDGTSTSQVTLNITGQRNSYNNLHIFGMANGTASAGAGSRSIIINGGGENYWNDCTLGGDTVARSDANATVEFQGGTTRHVFEDCRFISWSTAATPVHIDADAANAIDRFVLLKNCTFHNFGTAITEVMNVHATVNGNFVLHNSYSVGATDWEAVQSGNVFAEGDQTNNATVGLMELPTV